VKPNEPRRFFPRYSLVAALILAAAVAIAAYPHPRSPSAAPALRVASTVVDPTRPATVFPKVTLVDGECKDERGAVVTAETNHRRASEDYAQYEQNLINHLAGYTLTGLRIEEAKLLTATSALNLANYKLAQCQLAATKPATPCTSLALELNRRIAELEIAKRRVALAEAELDSANRAGTRAERLAATRALEDARTALVPAQRGVDGARLLVAIIKLLGLCGETTFEPTACNVQPPGGGGAVGSAAVTACAPVDPNAIPGSGDIDTYGEWVSAVTDWCAADPACGVVVPPAAGRSDPGEATGLLLGRG
jgi:hypothetical protein